MEYLQPKRRVVDDWTGRVFGFLTVVKFLGVHPKNGNKYWYCSCKCGNHKDVNAALLNSGHVKSCGCAKGDNSKSLNMADLLGRTFDSLTVLAIDNSGAYLYKVGCSCGSERTVKRYDLLSGHTKSCGCLPKPTKHGGTGTRLYSIWTAMLARCNRETSQAYPYYGARGIKVCSEWKDFAQFRLDMGEPPEPDSSIDRKDTLKGYSPDNCRWSGPLEQNNNKTSNVVYEYESKLVGLRELAECTGIKETTLSGRLYTGMTLSEAISGSGRTSKVVRKRVAGNLLYKKE